jgi:hypothetical protein
MWVSRGMPGAVWVSKIRLVLCWPGTYCCCMRWIKVASGTCTCTCNAAAAADAVTVHPPSSHLFAQLVEARQQAFAGPAAACEEADHHQGVASPLHELV